MRGVLETACDLKSETDMATLIDDIIAKGLPVAHAPLIFLAMPSMFSTGLLGELVFAPRRQRTRSADAAFVQPRGSPPDADDVSGPSSSA